MRRSTWTVAAIGAAVATIAACKSWIAGVPSEMRGNTPMTITNWTDTPVCKFGLTPAERPVDRNADWLGKLGKLGPGETRSYNIKPGDYTMTLHGCDERFTAEQPIRVERAVAVEIGDVQDRPPPGYAMLRARTVGNYGRYVAPAYAPDQPAGSEEPAASEGGGDEPASEGGGDEPAGQANQGEPCKPNGAEVSFSSDCCSGYTEQHGTLHNGGRSYCCGPSPNDCHSTEE